MILSLRFLMGWVALHCLVWALQAYALSVERLEYQCGNTNILICGTPLGRQPGLVRGASAIRAL